MQILSFNSNKSWFDNNLLELNFNKTKHSIHKISPLKAI